ncbi:hypothetical protein HK104_005469 [Borealophlyctis nickersoniae]|nr:hypothetical protein HK104_005469 [Borealophlyctis nickersoniae]
MGYGWYWLAIQQAERRELRREKVWNRIHLIPLLQAETDRDHVRRLEAAKKREAEVMKNVPGWSALDLKAPVQGIGRDGRRHEDEATPVYFTDRYIAPNFLFIPPEHGVRIPAQWWRGTKHFFTNPRYHNREDFTEEHPIGIAYD